MPAVFLPLPMHQVTVNGRLYVRDASGLVYPEIDEDVRAIVGVGGNVAAESSGPDWNVRAFGAAGDGVTDDTAAFSAAARGSAARVNIAGVEGTLPRAPMCQVMVPPGQYVLTSEVDTGNREVTWIVDPAATISGYEYLNGKVLRLGQRQTDDSHGTTDYATGYSIRCNTGLEDGAEVLGITAASDLASYTDRDSVALYVDNAGPAATHDAATATYTATTATITALSATAMKRLRRGMIIDTKHSPKWSGMLDSWSADGTVLRVVDGWYQSGTGAGTPANGTGLYVNGFTKVWAHNANVTLAAGSHATAAAGFELGVWNQKGALDYGTVTNFIWGYDAVNLGTYEGAVGFIARGGTAQFYRGFVCINATQAGYVASGTPLVGFYSDQASGEAFRFDRSGTNYFNVNTNGLVYARGGIAPGPSTAIWTNGTGSPEGVLAAPVGSMYTRTDGGAGTTLYVKESGTGNTGWVAK